MCRQWRAQAQVGSRALEEELMNLTEQIGPNHHPILGCDTLSPIHSSMRPAFPSGLNIQIASSIVGPGDSDTQRTCDHIVQFQHSTAC